ncbi:MAG: hypothetical protein Q9217_003190 [Psora testacea]
MATQSSPPSLVIDQTTILSLLAALTLLLAAYVASLSLLPASTTTKIRILFVWHLFDSLTHFLFEGSFLYNCFFTYTSIPHTADYPHPASLTSPGVYFLGYKNRLYGSQYGTSPTAKLWQEYAKADKRWGGADLTIISLELLTVFGAGPLAAYVCELVRQGDRAGKLWFWASVLATGELYGGFMTFAPEWLCCSPNLNTSNFLYLWVYLAFFNMLWVIFPLWVLVEAYNNISLAFARASGAIGPESKKKS